MSTYAVVALSASFVANIVLGVLAYRLARRLEQTVAAMRWQATVHAQRIEIAKDALKAIQARRKRSHTPPPLPYEAPLVEDEGGELAEGEFWIEPVSDPELGTIVAFGGKDGIYGTAHWPEGGEK